MREGRFTVLTGPCGRPSLEASAPARDGDAVAGRSDPRGRVPAIRMGERIGMQGDDAGLGVLR